MSHSWAMLAPILWTTLPNEYYVTYPIIHTTK